MTNTKTLPGILDNFRRDDLRSEQSATETKLVKRYQITYTVAGGERKASVRLYPYQLARKIVSRLNRKYCRDAFAHPLNVRIPA